MIKSCRYIRAVDNANLACLERWKKYFKPKM